MTFLNGRAGWLSAGLLMIAASAQAQGVLTAPNGMTLYVFDNDTDGVSTCYDTCAENWPPYLGTASDPVTKDWSLVPRSDGTMQWAFDGKPTYFFKSDAAAGDMNGDGVGGVWHVISE